MALRTTKTLNSYLKFIKNGFLAEECNLCNKKKAGSIKKFKYWRIVDNLFPWDRIAKIHHMIIPKRHIVYTELTQAEKKEFDAIKIKYIEKNYDLIAEATQKKKTIPEHLHIHLIILRKK